MADKTTEEGEAKAAKEECASAQAAKEAAEAEVAELRRLVKVLLVMHAQSRLENNRTQHEASQAVAEEAAKSWSDYALRHVEDLEAQATQARQAERTGPSREEVEAIRQIMAGIASP